MVTFLSWITDKNSIFNGFFGPIKLNMIFFTAHLTLTLWHSGYKTMIQPIYSVYPPQPAVHVQGQEPLTASMLAAAPPQEQKQMLGVCPAHIDFYSLISFSLVDFCIAETLPKAVQY